VQRATEYSGKALSRPFRQMAVLLAVPAFLLIVALFGCASHAGAIASDLPTAISSGKVQNVPFYPQVSYQCGPASLAGVLSFYGGHVTPDQIAEAIFRKDLRGTVTLDMVLYARQKGFSARWYSGSADDIRRSVDEGVPLIVMVDLGLARVSRNHYMVVVGYSPEGIIANSGKVREKSISWSRFLTQWNRAGRWTLRVERKNCFKSNNVGR
jgi:ABC-type bacteriocin/lantibiotic exporter with double-glycine peptidase domain